MNAPYRMRRRKGEGREKEEDGVKSTGQVEGQKDGAGDDSHDQTAEEAHAEKPHVGECIGSVGLPEQLVRVAFKS
jgi:hypothetical protein